MEDVIIIIILIIIVLAGTAYLYREKKRGNKCIGCPHGKQCNGGCSHHKKQ